jgi:hypothetical protein
MNTFQEKIRSIQVQGFQHAENRKTEKALERYRQVRREGSQPQGTQPVYVEQAQRESDRLGRPFRADDLATTYHPEVKIQPMQRSPYFPKTEE